MFVVEQHKQAIVGDFLEEKHSVPCSKSHGSRNGCLFSFLLLSFSSSYLKGCKNAMVIGWQNSRLAAAVCVLDPSEKEEKGAMRRNAERVNFSGWSVVSSSQPEWKLAVPSPGPE